MPLFKLYLKPWCNFTHVCRLAELKETISYAESYPLA